MTRGRVKLKIRTLRNYFKITKLKIIKLFKMISYEDFKKVEMKVGEIKEVELVDGSDKLLKLKVLFGEEERQILSGIRKFFDDYNVLIGKKVPFVINLEPRKMMGLESQGMILAVNDDEGNFSLLEVDNKIKSGSSVS